MKESHSKQKQKGYHHVAAIGSRRKHPIKYFLSRAQGRKTSFLELLRDYYKEFSTLSVPQRIALYHLREDRADVISPSPCAYFISM